MVNVFLEGKLFMEYTHDYGFLDDVPLDFISQNVRRTLPSCF